MFSDAKYFITEQKCGPNSRDQDSTKWTPLHYASKGGHVNIIQCLITELGCNQSIVDLLDRTIYTWLVTLATLHIVQWLLHNGHLNMKPKDFITEQPVLTLQGIK